MGNPLLKICQTRLGKMCRDTEIKHADSGIHSSQSRRIAENSVPIPFPSAPLRLCASAFLRLCDDSVFKDNILKPYPIDALGSRILLNDTILPHEQKIVHSIAISSTAK